VNLSNLPEIYINGAPGYSPFWGWQSATFHAFDGKKKHVVLFEWDGKIECAVIDDEYVEMA
jgi:hypothetical protein